MKSWQILILGIVVLNIAILDVLVTVLWQKSKEAPPAPIVETKYIYPTAVPTLVPPSPTDKPTAAPIINKKNRLTTIIPIPGNGSTMENKWKDIAGTEFNLNTEDYPNLLGAYLEVNMRLFNGNGTAFVRLFDMTAGIEVWGSEVKTNSQNFTVITSEKLILRSGNHLYRIQAKSLTADTTVYNSGRIRVITED